jgi:hypothetical protein
MDNIDNPDSTGKTGETNTADPLNELKHALDALSPRDLAAWTAWVENRLTERLRQRQEHGRPAGAGVGSRAADAPGPPADE